MELLHFIVVGHTGVKEILEYFCRVQRVPVDVDCHESQNKGLRIPFLGCIMEQHLHSFSSSSQISNLQVLEGSRVIRGATLPAHGRIDAPRPKTVNEPSTLTWPLGLSGTP